MKKFVFIALLIGVVGGCNIDQVDFDNLKEPKLNSLVAFPIGQLQYTMRDLIDKVNDESVEIVEDSATTLISLVYRDTIEYESDSALIEVPDITNSQRVSFVPIPVPVPADTSIAIPSPDLNFEYQPENDEVVDSLVYRDGLLSFELYTPINDVDYTFQVNNITDPSGNPVIFTDEDTDPKSLVNHRFFFIRQDGINTFSADFNATLNLVTGDQLTADDSIVVSLTISDQEFEVIYGDFGTDTLDIDSQELDVSFFEDFGEDALEFQGPEMNFEFQSSFGVPIGIDFDGIYAAKDGDTLYLEVTSPISDRTIESPAITNIGGTETSSISVNKFNSNFNELLASTPSSLVFDVSGITNPRSTDGENFFIEGTSMSAYVEVALPMIISMNELTREIDFDLSADLSQLESADSMAIRLVTINELPFDVFADLQIINAVDTVDSIIHEVANNLVIAIPFIDPITGLTREPKVSISDIVLSQAGIDALIDGNKLNMVLKLSTPQSLNSQDIFVRILARYSLEVRVAILANVKSIPN